MDMSKLVSIKKKPVVKGSKPAPAEMGPPGKKKPKVPPQPY